MRQLLISVYRAILALLGALLLVVSVPHSTPWDMSLFARTVHEHSLVFGFTIPFSDTRIFMNTSLVFILMLVFVTLAFLAIPRATLRAAWRSHRQHPISFTGSIAGAEVLLFTLLPSEPHFITTGPASVLYLLTASMGLFLFFAGLIPVLHRLGNDARFMNACSRVYQWIRDALMESPATLFVTTLVLIELALASTISLLVFEGIPHVQDSIAQLFHARIFAEGSLTAPSPPLPGFYEFINVINDGRWYSQYPPGHTALLTLGVLIGLPWIINPLLGALTVGATYLLGKELFDETIGRVSALLALLSPFLLFMSAEYMNHSSTLLLTTLFLLFFVRALRTGAFFDGLLAGAAIGWAGTARPLTAAAIAAPALIYGLVRLVRDRNRLARPVAGFLLSAAAFLGILLAFNDLTNGHPLVFGYEKLWGPLTGVGFGKGPWGPPHTPLNGLTQSISNLNGINKYLFEWPVPSLLFVVVLLFRTKANRWDLLLLSTFGSLVLFYFFYWFQDWCFGPRFLFEASTALFILTARGIRSIPEIWNGVLGLRAAARTVRIASISFVALLILLGLATNIPPHLAHYGNHYWGVSREILDQVEERGIERAVVFVRSNYGRGFIGNDPFLRNKVQYVKDLGTENRRMAEQYPDHEYYLAAGGTLMRYDPLEGITLGGPDGLPK